MRQPDSSHDIHDIELQFQILLMPSSSKSVKSVMSLHRFLRPLKSLIEFFYSISWSTAGQANLESIGKIKASRSLRRKQSTRIIWLSLFSH